MINISFQSNWLVVICCFVAGCIMPLSFAPYNLAPLAIIALACLSFLLINSSPKQAFCRGYAFGLGLFGFGVWWIYIALRYFGNAEPILAALLTLLLISYLALFPALVSWVFARLHLNSTTSKLLILFPCAWTLTEFLRGWLLTGFPWLLVGYSQLTSPISGFAPITGIYGLSFITTFIAGALALTFHQQPRRPYLHRALYAAIAIFLSGWLTQQIHWTHPNHKALKVSVVQGNIEREFKWDPQKALQNIDIHRQLTKNVWDADFVVWPESSFSFSQLYGRELLNSISADAKKHHTTLSVGLPYIDTQGRYFNALMLLGDDHGKYFKRHLVPFGEFTPFHSILSPMLKWLKIPMSDFTEGAANQGLLMVHGIPVAPFICYEIVYPSLVNRDLPKAQILLTISEDAWYGDSNAVYQHLQMAQMRSLESGRYSVFAVNTGVSAIIDQRGHIIQSLGMHQRGVISANVPAMIGATPWAVMGDSLWLWLITLGLMATILISRIRSNVHHSPSVSPSHSNYHS